MFETLYWIVGILVLCSVVVPVLLVWLVIKYIFKLRARQNKAFLNELRLVVHDAVLDALKDNESAKRYTKTTQTNYISKK